MPPARLLAVLLLAACGPSALTGPGTEVLRGTVEEDSVTVPVRIGRLANGEYEVTTRHPGDPREPLYVNTMFAMKAARTAMERVCVHGTESLSGPDVVARGGAIFEGRFQAQCATTPRSAEALQPPHPCGLLFNPDGSILRAAPC